MFRTQTHNRKCLSLQSKQHNPQILNRLNRPAAAMKRGGGSHKINCARGLPFLTVTLLILI